MFKFIPGNNHYLISLSLDMRKTDGSLSDLPIKHGIKISIVQRLKESKSKQLMK